MSQHNIVQAMFYLSTIRKVPRGASIFELEYQFNKVIHSLTIEEVAIVCSGFFKSQTKSNIDDVNHKIISKVIENKNNIDPISSAAIFKVIFFLFLICTKNIILTLPFFFLKIL